MTPAYCPWIIHKKPPPDLLYNKSSRNVVVNKNQDQSSPARRHQAADMTATKPSLSGTKSRLKSNTPSSSATAAATGLAANEYSESIRRFFRRKSSFFDSSHDPKNASAEDTAAGGGCGGGVSSSDNSQSFITNTTSTTTAPGRGRLRSNSRCSSSCAEQCCSVDSSQCRSRSISFSQTSNDRRESVLSSSNRSRSKSVGLLNFHQAGITTEPSDTAEGIRPVLIRQAANKYIYEEPAVAAAAAVHMTTIEDWRTCDSRDSVCSSKPTRKCVTWDEDHRPQTSRNSSRSADLCSNTSSARSSRSRIPPASGVMSPIFKRLDGSTTSRSSSSNRNRSSSITTENHSVQRNMEIVRHRRLDLLSQLSTNNTNNCVLTPNLVVGVPPYE